MATSITFKQGDTHPPLDGTLSDQDGPINLTGAAVEVVLRTKGTVPTNRGGDCEITDAILGKVRYLIVTADTLSAQTFDGEFKITWSNGKVTRVPNSGYFSVVVEPNLGEAPA